MLILCIMITILHLFQRQACALLLCIMITVLYLFHRLACSLLLHVHHNYNSVSLSQTGLFIVTVYYNYSSVSVSQTGLFIVTVHHKTVLCLFHRVIESLGPSNTRKYVVAVYFRGERLATGTGHSIQQAEMSAATNALKIRAGESWCRNC